jgi:hypothetical protein
MEREGVVGGRRAELTLSCLAKSPRIYTKARVTTRAPNVHRGDYCKQAKATYGFTHATLRTLR